MWFIDRLKSEYGTPNIFKDAVTIINIRFWIRDENNYLWYILVKDIPVILVYFTEFFAIFSIFGGFKSFLGKKPISDPKVNFENIQV